MGVVATIRVSGREEGRCGFVGSGIFLVFFFFFFPFLLLFWFEGFWV